MAVPTASQGRRLPGVAFLTRHNDLSPSMLAGRVDTAVIRAGVEPLRDQMDKRRDGRRDHAPRPRSNAFRQPMPTGVRKG
jgi:hypothetical protein